MDDTHRRLADVVAGILGSYQDHGNINHLDGSNLPSRAEIGQLLDDLLSLVFPGYLGADLVDELSSPYFVGERCARSLRALERVIGRAMGVQCADQGESRTARAMHDEAHEHAMTLLRTIPEIRRLLATDVRAALEGDPAACSPPEVITAYPGITAIATHRIAHCLYLRGVPMIPRMMSEQVHGRTGIDIHPGATIGESFFIDHGTGVVIGETTLIGDRVKLYQGVTLGAHSVDVSERSRKHKRHPTLEDGVTVYAGATILGGNTVIGRGSVIGGNVWLTHSVPANTTVMLDKPSLKFLTAGDRS
ncbi:MAG: serine acetyltransferase [Myxococcales bacterium]|nr:serine acetyltransferase [Myxococcales bacterium]